MSFQIEINQRLVTVQLEKKRNIKHVYLRVLNPSLIQIKTNIYYTLYDAKNLIEKKIDWISTSILKLEKKSVNEDEFLYLGEIRKLEDFKIKNLDLFYKKEIKKILPIFLEEISTKMKLYPTSLSFRKNKRTWGSCNYKNGLNFNILDSNTDILDTFENIIKNKDIVPFDNLKNQNKKLYNKLVEDFGKNRVDRKNLFEYFTCLFGESISSFLL